MVEKETIFSSNMKYTGVLSFPDFYRFCYDWMSDDMNLIVMETKYTEKISGEAKQLEIKWTGFRKITDYFKYEVKLEFRIVGLKKIEVMQLGKKINTNEGAVELKVKGDLIRDYQGKFETSGFNKFLRSVYEKWVIPGRVEQYEDKLVELCDEFLAQAKAYLDLEGKKH